MKSGLSIGQDGRGKQCSNSLLYFSNNGNSLQDSQTLAYFTSSCGSRAHGLSVLAGESWRRSIALYSARKLVKGHWVNDKDEYLAPQTEKEGYEQWVDDCHVYALLHSSNNMTSMRDVEYKGKNHNIHNHFFWLNKSDALNMYDSSESLASYRDCQKSKHTPYFAEVLPSLSLSPLAQELLDDLTEILRDPNTHKLRASADSSLHAISWDIGVYQLNKLLKVDTRWVTLKRKALLLRDQLSCGVYRYGFLKK